MCVCVVYERVLANRVCLCVSVCLSISFSRLAVYLSSLAGVCLSMCVLFCTVIACISADRCVR